MSNIPQELQKVLENIAEAQEYVNPKFVIESVDGGGGNFSSRLFAITMSAAGKPDLQLFGKFAAFTEQLRSLTKTLVYNTELVFYTKLLPKYRKLEERYNIPAEDRLRLPKYYGSSLKYMNEVIVLEDLGSAGYQPFDRFECYDWEYAKKCVNFMASLHALSVAYQKDDPDKSIELMESPIKFMEQSLAKSLPMIIASTEEAYRTKLEHYVEEKLNYENLRKVFGRENPVVYNHGDFRPNNIVHKKDKDGKLEVILLDHQMINLGNPLGDLVYFLICGSDEEFRSKHLQGLFDHYYAEFSKNLRRFGLKPDEVYSEEQYHMDIDEVLPLGLLMGIFLIPAITAYESDSHKPIDGIGTDCLLVELNDLFVVRFNGLVRDYARMGML